MKLLILISFLFPGLQQADSVLSEQEVIELALANNFDIKLVKYDLETALNNNTAGNAGMLPTLDLNGNARQSLQNTEQEFFSGDTQSREGAKTSNYSAGASFNWTLFDGLKMFSTKHRLDQVTYTNEQAYMARVQNSISDVIKAFYNTALEQERLALLQSSLEVSQERVEISKNKYEVGKASKLEYLQAQVDFNTDQSALVKQQEVILRKKLELIQLIGVSSMDVNFELTYDFEILQKWIETEHLESEAISQNPLLRQLESQREENILSIQEAQRSVLPSLDFNLGYNYSNLNAEAGFLKSNQTDGFTYGLTATMNLFDGMNQKREIQNAQIQSQKAWTAYQQAETQLRTAVRSGILTLQNAQTLINLERSNLSVAEENVEIALERYRIGKSNPLEIREAQNNAVNAQIRYLEALNTAKIAEIELMRLSGGLVVGE